MTFKVKCDGCGKEVEPPVNSIGIPYNPPGWRSRTPIDGLNTTYHACSEACLDDCVKKFGGMVAPF
jgi:hypothetical protein